MALSLVRPLGVATIAAGVALVAGIVIAAESPGTSPPLAARVLVVREGDVRVRCPLTIGGSFDARTKALSGTARQGATSIDSWIGEFVVDLTGLDTGISLRNQHLRDHYLEVGKGPDFARAVMTDIRLSGLAGAAPEGKGTFTARLRLHGTERPVTGQAELRPSGSAIRVRASFPVVLDEFGIAKPRYLGVGVKEEVTVQVTFEATPAEGTR